MLQLTVNELRARERQAGLLREAEADRLARLAEGNRPAGGVGLKGFLGRVRLRLAAPRGAAAALPRTAHPSKA
ncbi:MAG: hypothetical protein HY334_03320 [Armatimonadetes bacterium]|nr:hypothetical protein [Armatimonadota bacterium]